MPYKKKEDRTEAVRRHRERKRGNKARAEKAAKIDASLGGLLKLIGFVEVPFEVFAEICREIEKDAEGVWHDIGTGHIIYPPDQVFFGLNTMIAGNHLDDQLNAFAILFQALLDYADNGNPKS